MIPVVSDLLCQPGVMVGVGLGMCIGFFARGSFLTDNGNADMMDSGGGGSDDSEDEGWDEVRAVQQIDLFTVTPPLAVI